MRIVFMLALVACVAGCMSLPPESRIPLSADDLALLKSHKDIVLTGSGDIKGSKQLVSSDSRTDQYGFRIGSLRYRILKYSKSLQLSSAEIKALSAMNSVTICGKCGNLKGGLTCCVEGARVSSTGYAKGSLINRILGYKYTLPKLEKKSVVKK
jgi:hypothetical protein